MNYTERVQSYCHAHNNSILDVSAVRYNEFADIPYKTILKILNRLEEEGFIQSVSKGVYYIGAKRLTEDFLLSKCIDNGKGTVIGYELFNRIGLSSYQDDKVEAYTNIITSQQKTIGRLRLKRADLFFDDATIDVISLLEILDAGFTINDCDYNTYRNVTELLGQSYSDEIFGKIVPVIKYKYSTIEKLSALLDRIKISNNCIEIYN